MVRLKTTKKLSGTRFKTAGVLITVILSGVLVAGTIAVWIISGPAIAPSGGPGGTAAGPVINQVADMEPFADVNEFTEWMVDADAKAQQSGYFGGFSRGMVVEETALGMDMAAPSAIGLGMKEDSEIGGAGVERFSETNVQVMGIDEPDILKTDGEEIYYSPQSGYYFPMPRIEMMDTEMGMIAPSPDFYRQPTIKAIDAFPPEDMEIDSEIEKTGNLLLHDDVLTVLSHDGIYAYDVSDPEAPKETWNYSYERSNYPVASRLRDGKLYVVLASGINRGRPCPYVPVLRDGEDVSIRCDSIWHPIIPVPSDVTYTVLKVDMVTGETVGTVSFVGSRSASTVYMSADNIYVTYVYPPDVFTFISGFLGANSDLVPGWAIRKIKRVSGYDISEEAKLVELRNIMEQWTESMDEDEMLRVANELENRADIWFKAHSRELQSTGIVRVNVEGLEVESSGTVPGLLLNQFSLDEYQDHLRVATTVGESRGLFWQFGFSGSGESANDVYVLDMGMNTVGSALDMGLDERIYSVRFLKDRGYVVTFRQIDPFYVLDLSDPTAPLIKGELKIPGYSSYLHPMPDGSVLGIGKEDNRVKISLFDVTDPASPKEVSKYTLNEYWSDILSTHHAFLLDAKHEIFFLPGSRGGYVFSYEDNEFELVKAVSEVSARRALYINDFLYVVGDDEIVVLDMEDWERVSELGLRQ
ncbi:MAG: beta-propeller domain-containing protein [Patescibacteria group bacterium]|nr:beta-propeller domain-containing protein [Patescibacteria group bacterium]